MPEQRKRIQRTQRRGATIANVIGVIVCVVILAIIVLPLMNGNRRGGHVTRDSTHIRGIQQSWLVYAREVGGVMPTPSELKWQAVQSARPSIFNFADRSLDTTANLHSMLIMQNYYSPVICIGPTEPSPTVRVFDEFNYELYDVAQRVFWDSGFKADLQTGSHVSYASMPLYGRLRANHWSDSADSSWPIVGNRGPRNGVHDPKSVTSAIHPPHDQWSGNICFSDNHVEFFTGLTPNRRDPGVPFNTQGVFRYDGEDDADGILAFTKAMTKQGPTLQWD